MHASPSTDFHDANSLSSHFIQHIWNQLIVLTLYPAHLESAHPSPFIQHIRSQLIVLTLYPAHLESAHRPHPLSSTFGVSSSLTIYPAHLESVHPSPFIQHIRSQFVGVDVQFEQGSDLSVQFGLVGHREPAGDRIKAKRARPVLQPVCEVSVLPLPVRGGVSVLPLSARGELAFSPCQREGS